MLTAPLSFAALFFSGLSLSISAQIGLVLVDDLGRIGSRPHPSLDRSSDDA